MKSLKSLEALLVPPGRAITTDAPAEDLWDALQALRGRGLETRILRATRMRNMGQVLAEFAAALQIPPYFGENLNALDECLNDLEWLPGGPLVLVILQAELVLDRGAAKDRDLLAGILAGATAAWAQGANGPARAVSVIFQTPLARDLPGPR